MILQLNSFGSTSLILVYDQFLLTNGAHVGVSYTGIEKNSMDSPTHYSAIISSFY